MCSAMFSFTSTTQYKNNTFFMLNPALNIIGGRITLKKTSGSNVACNTFINFTLAIKRSSHKLTGMVHDQFINWTGRKWTGPRPLASRCSWSVCGEGEDADNARMDTCDREHRPLMMSLLPLSVSVLSVLSRHWCTHWLPSSLQCIWYHHQHHNLFAMNIIWKPIEHWKWRSTRRTMTLDTTYLPLTTYLLTYNHQIKQNNNITCIHI